MESKPILTLAVVRQRFPRLFDQYTILSNREKEALEMDDDGYHVLAQMLEPKPDPATGLYTMISGIDFSEPEPGRPEDRPMEADSEAYKFAQFLNNMLHACDNANRYLNDHRECKREYFLEYREDEENFDLWYSEFYGALEEKKVEVHSMAFDVMDSALKDIFAMDPEEENVKVLFEPLFGWFMAAGTHGVKNLLYKGDRSRNRSLFKKMADKWKSVLSSEDTRTGVPLDRRVFAFKQYLKFASLLKKSSYGEIALKPFGRTVDTFVRVNEPAEMNEPAAAHKPRKRQKKDPNAPKRPLSAFILYANSIRAQVREEYPGLSTPGIQKEIAERYKKISESERASLKEQVKAASELYKKKKLQYKYRHATF